MSYKLKLYEVYQYLPKKLVKETLKKYNYLSNLLIGTKI